jgi:hypothetical protein
MHSMNSYLFDPLNPTTPHAQDAREWMPQDGSRARRALVVMGARIRPEWLDRSVDVVQVRFVRELAQVLGDLVALASSQKGMSLPTTRLKASLALMLDGIIVIDRQLGLNPERPKPAIELYTEDADDAELIERVRSCLKIWNNDVVQPWARATGLADAVEHLSRAITGEGIAIGRVSQPLVVRTAGARLGKPAYHLIARRLAEELVGATLFEGMSPVDLVVDPANTTASVELLTQPVRMEGSRSMFSMAARLSVFTMPSSQDLFVKVTPVKRIWSSDLPGRKPNAPPSVTCTVMVPGKPFLTVKAVQTKPNAGVAQDENAPHWRFSDDYEEFLRRSGGNLPATLKDAVAEVAPDRAKEGWWVGFPRLTTLFDRIGGRTVFERDEFDLHETVVQMLPWALDPKLDVRKVKAIAQKAAADATHTALKPSDIGQSDDSAEPGHAGQALLEDDANDDDGLATVGDVESARLERLAAGRSSNIAALQALHPNRPIHLFVFGGEQNEQAIILACAGVLFGDAVKVHMESLPLHTHGLKAELEKADAKSLERFEARVARWEAAFKQLPDDGGVRHVMICADRIIGRRLEDPVNYYAAIHAACRAAGANVHHVLPIQQKRGKDDVGHFVHRVQSAMLDVFLAHSGVILGVNELVMQTIGQGRTATPGGADLPKHVFGIQALRSRARRRSAESNVTFILYTRLSLQTGLVAVRIACRIGKKDTLTDWMDLASGLRWLGSQRQIASNEGWIKGAFQQQTRSVLAQLKTEDAHAIVLIDWDRLKNLWPNLRDESLCESACGTLMLGPPDLAQACPGMTFVRLRSSRETSMTMRLLVTKLYEGWVSNGQAYESTGEVYTERYLGPAHEIVEVLAPDAKDRAKPGRTGNRHYLQVMRYRRTVQLQRGYSCYRSSERMKKIDGSDKTADAPSSKRFRLVKFDPAHEDAALPSTTEVTIVAGPAGLDADQVVRLVMGLRLRYAHYPDWTALPAPLFFIAKVDDYVIPYADLLLDEDEAAAPATADEVATAAEEITGGEPMSVPGVEAAEAEVLVPTSHDPYFDDVSRAIATQLPQMQLFSSTSGVQGDNLAMWIAKTENDSSSQPSGHETNGHVREVRDHPHGEATLPGDGTRAATTSAEAVADEAEREQAAQAEAEVRRPKDDRLARAWSLIQDVPCLYSVSDPSIKRLYEDMMREQVRIHVDLPWFINVNTVVPLDAWPDHKAINKFWRQQGNMGLRLPTKAAPSTGEFKTWLMRRLRAPQSSWSISSQLFKGGARLFATVFEHYDLMLAERAAEGLDPPEIHKGSTFNSEVLAAWLRKNEDDEGLAWLVAMAAHWPDAHGVERIFEAMDGLTLGPMTSCALEYLVDCCEVARDIATTTVADRRGLVIQHKRDPKWEELCKQAQQVKTATPRKDLDAAAGTVDRETAQADAVKDKSSDASANPRAAGHIPAPQAAPAAALSSDVAVSPVSGQSEETILGERGEEAQTLCKAMADAISRMSPGSDDFAEALQDLHDASNRMNGLHAKALESRERIARERQAHQEREKAIRVNRIAVEQQLQAFFGELGATCASIPEDLSGEPHKVPGDAQAWLAHALSNGRDGFDAWMQSMRAQLAAVKDAAAQIVSTHGALESLDNGSDERLAKVSGLARRQLLHTLQDELIAAADEANRHLSEALIGIAYLGPQAGPGQPDGGGDSHADCAAADTSAPTGGTTTAAVHAANLAAALPGAVELAARKETRARADRQVDIDAIDEADAEFTVDAKQPTVPAVQVDQIESTAHRAESDGSTTQSEGTDSDGLSPAAAAAVVNVLAKAVAPSAGVAPVVDADGREPSDDEESLETKSEALVRPIEEDAEFDVRALDLHLEPLLRAAGDRLWKLTKVGVAALCAVNPHPTVTIHGSAWTSMLDSLSALTTVGAEQRLNDGLMRWLESGPAAIAGEGKLAFAMDVGVLGAGLLPILFEGHEAKVRWAVLSRISARLQESKPLHALCEHLQGLDSSAFTITRENLSASRVGPRKALEAEVLRQRERAQHWSGDQALFSNWPNPEYWDMHSAMFDDRHGMHFHKALQYVVRGSDAPLRKMMPELRKYVDKIAGTLSDLRKRTGRKRPLEGPHADKLAQNVATTIKFLENYLLLNERLGSVASNATPKPLRDFLDQLYERTQAAQEYLSEIASTLAGQDGERAEDGPLRLHMTLALQVLQSTLSLMDEQTPQAPVAENDQVLLMDVPMNSALQPVWSVRLEADDQEAQLRDPLVVIAEVGSVHEQLAHACQVRPQQTIEDLLVSAADVHRKNGELLAARAIEQRMRGASPQVLSQLQSATDAAHRKQKNHLSEELSDARQRVTSALSVGPMTQAEATRMLKVIEVLDRANRENQIGVISSTPTPYEDYPQARAILRQHILEPLEKRIDESLRALKSDMAAYRDKVDKLDEAERLRKIEQLDRILAGIKEATPTNIRVARYSFSLLEQNELPFIKLSAVNAAQEFDAFQKDLRGFASNHSSLESLRDALREGDAGKQWPKGQKPAWAESLTEGQREEAAAFLDSWIALTEARTLNEIHEPLAEFFKAAGTVESPAAMSEPGNNGRTAFHLPSKTFVGSARLQNFWVPPTLGSAARDLRGVVLRHRPQAELMAQIIGELPMNTPSFVLGRTHLTLARRSAITRDHPVIIVDDDLVAYMAVHPDQRLAKMMEVGLLTFHDNPYDDYGGPVPTEMFFGRRTELLRLAGNKSAMVLYGGRRLGKSSLLDRIQFESRQNLVRTGGEARGEVAIYIPLESRIDSAVFGDDHKLFAWMGIYRGMVNNEFIRSAKVEPKTADGLREYIRSEIMGGNALTGDCYLLIDEADEVMARDIETAGSFATSLRALCDDVRDVCRIRYVIAGLHNLTRMHTEGNTALAKADAIALQPFSSGQDILMGVELITKPLAALGFIFPKSSEDLPMRILAMCNFYPAFVQLYCKNLIQDLYNKRGNSPPTTPIEAADLDKVERNKDFIGVMQEKFRYNLDLDKRYKAIALILADTYYRGNGSGVEQGLTASEIRDLCQMMFPNHFSKTGEGAFPALLDEMEKLTVIDRKGGRFQLRTPHIATMMGSRDDVDHKIDELGRETAPGNRIPGETRPFLIRGNGNERTAFPMPSGWVRQLLHEEERNLTILVGNHLSGLAEIEGLKQSWTIGRDAQFESKFFSNIDNARPYINSVRRLTANEPTNRIVAVPSRAWNKSQIGDYAAFANSLARPLLTLDQRQRATNVRLVLIANPQQAWELAQLVHAAGIKRGWGVEAVPPWNDDAVYYRLKQVENQALPDHPDACAHILEGTLGFGREISKLLRAGLTFEGIAQARDELVRRIASNRTAFYDAIGWPGSLDATDIRHAEELLALLDGEKRSESAAISLAADCGVSPPLLTFLRWMGLLQDAGDGTWRVPIIYKALITPPPGTSAIQAEATVA